MTKIRIAGVLAVALAALTALMMPAVAGARDRDRDRMPDSWEKRYKLNTRVNDARRDKDHDGLRNVDEYRSGTSPRDRDTDNDGRRDDRERAGRVESFDSSTGQLTITLFGGGSITGIVNSSTELKCENEDGAGTPAGDTRGDGTPEDRVALARHGDDDSSGPGSGDDDNRHGDDDRGDDRDDNDDRGGDRDRTCPSGALKAGAIVKEADITGNGTQTIFDEIELAN